MVRALARAARALALGALAALGGPASGQSETESTDVWKTLDECNNIVGYATGTAPGCECAHWQEGDQVPAGCHIPSASDEEIRKMMGEARALADGVLWLLGYAQTLLVLLAGASLLALGAAAYTGALNVQWLAIISLLTVVGASATSIVAFTGSGHHGGNIVNLWEGAGEVRLRDSTGIIVIEPVDTVTVREGDTR